MPTEIQVLLTAIALLVPFIVLDIAALRWGVYSSGDKATHPGLDI